jgi:hypothetical protein
MHDKVPLFSLALVAALAAGPGHATLQDGIDVDDDGTSAPGQARVQWQVNTTPSGRGVPAYPGEVPPLHAVRITPEVSWGIAPAAEVALSVPTVVRPDGRYEAAGAKVNVKWVPLRPVDGVGAFAGVKAELGHLAFRYSQSPTSLETRFIAGWRNADWLLAVNPALAFGLSPGWRARRPDLALAVKVARNVRPGIAGGVELYATPGPLGRALSWREQDNRIFLALDVDRKPWIFNVGVGRGLTPAADRWTLKAIFELPLQQLFGG